MLLKNDHELLKAVIYEEFGSFVQAVNPTWLIPPFHKEIFRHLSAHEDCVISLPPDHSKSTIASVFFPVWWWGRNPSKRIILAVGSPRLVSVFAIQIRQLMEHPIFKEVFDLRVRKDSDGTTVKTSLQGGSINIVSKGQAIAGLRADLIIFDDIVGSAKDAMSSVTRDKDWSFITQDLFTRASPNVQVVGIGTRWHEDDVLCRLEHTRDFAKFMNIKYPALTAEGAALWPERHDAEDLLATKAMIGSSAFEALYQQNPLPSEGGLIKRAWWRYYKEVPRDIIRKVQFWDCAQKVGITNDFSVCATWAETPTGYYLLDVFHDRLEAPQLEMAVKNIYRKHMPNAVVIEDKSSGSSIIQSIRQNTKLPVLAYDPKQRDKEVRASAATPMIEAGNCYLPESEPWVEDFILEHERFPNAKHDDQVDTTSMMAEFFRAPRPEPRIRIL